MTYEQPKLNKPEELAQPDLQPSAVEPADEVARDTTADAYIAEIVADAPTGDSGRMVAEMYARHGTAFAVYLTLDGVERYPSDEDASLASRLETDFVNCFRGRFPDRASLIDHTVESLDWITELNGALRGHPTLREVVVFDRDAIWAFINAHYDVIDGHDGVYVFER